MVKRHFKLLIFGGIFVVGLIILMNSTNLGENEISNIMRHNGGSMDTDKYLIYLEQSIIEYRFVGAILSIVGGLGVCINTSKGTL